MLAKIVLLSGKLGLNVVVGLRIAALRFRGNETRRKKRRLVTLCQNGTTALSKSNASFAFTIAVPQSLF